MTDHNKPIHQEHKMSYEDLVKLNQQLQMEKLQLNDLLVQYSSRLNRIAMAFQDDRPTQSVEPAGKPAPGVG